MPSPLTGERDRIVVNVVQGLGESLVSGRASADQYVLRKRDGTLIASHPPDTAKSQALAFLPTLLELALAVERRFGTPQDIEWAAVDDKVFLLQARPITNLRPEPIAFAEAQRPILCYSDRWREIVPSALTPLMGDLTLRIVLPLVNEAMVHHGFLPPTLARDLASSATPRAE